MPWLQLSIDTSETEAGAVEARLEAGGALAVTLMDAGDEPQLEPAPGETPLWSRVRVVGLFAADPEGERCATEQLRFFTQQPGTGAHLERLVDQVWERVWLDTFKPARFGRRLWVCPHGQAPEDQEAVVVFLDPGLAFGTGHHPTTALCLEWLDGADLAGRTLLDYGCGSGILAIAALRLGAAKVVAVDHDPQALEATRENALANGLDTRLTICAPDELGDPRTDLVVANILAAPLIELAPRLTDALRPGGALALSGVLVEQVASVSAAYATHIALAPVRQRDGWALISGARQGSCGGG